MSGIPVPRSSKVVRSDPASSSSSSATSTASSLTSNGVKQSQSAASLAKSLNSTSTGIRKPSSSVRSATTTAPMNNATNRNTAASTKSVPSSSIRGKAAAMPPKRIPSGSSRPIGRTVSGGASARGSGGSEDSTAQWEAFQQEFRMEQEKNMEKLHQQMRQEREAREAQDAKVRMLEEDLLEQRKVANEKSQEVNRRRTAHNDELLEITAKFNREKRRLEEELDIERDTVRSLKNTLAQQSTAHLTHESTVSALRTQADALKLEIETSKLKCESLRKQHQETLEANSMLENELREAETLRRKLHNEVQELRGNIRVFARVRPSNNNDARSGAGEELATIRYPNEREANQIELLAAGESATGTATMKNHQFSFDRVFRPEHNQADVFEEIAHLTQSVLDGFNVAIFAYGQTGSGKTHTLEGASEMSSASDPSSDANAGMIPRAVQMLWKTAESLKDKGWKYDFQGQMLEIYNETINDLLGKSEVDKAKHEIKHEKNRTIVSDTVVVPLESPASVYALLAKAKSRRQVAATLMNERSSRSHSVFILRVRGQNVTTMESCDAVLNLVDLAGSERLSNSGSGNDPARLKEAQSINKSLSSLADVIASLGSNSSHVPYRNSQLTWLLKNSLGGNSKTLMLLALSPMAAHMNESLCSLRFATKVNSTVIGTAKRVVKQLE